MQLCLVIVCMFVFCVMSNIMLHHAKVSSYVGVCIFKKTTAVHKPAVHVFAVRKL